MKRKTEGGRGGREEETKSVGEERRKKEQGRTGSFQHLLQTKDLSRIQSLNT